ncbi:aldehyde dehydrogenase family protein [Humidisolicoccus flavus]|uniref:aldehyde dehydrogenase family protein n=1 Tax=Humidisolicoccus flavus TaxID=3111414 RepID=UPI00324B29A1
MKTAPLTSRSDQWSLLEGALPMLINGVLVTDTETADIVSPRDRSVVGRFAVASPEHIDDAVSTARAAWPAWAALPGKERAKFLLRIAEVMESHASEFEFLDAVDIGKPVTNVRYSDIPVSLDALAYFAGRASDIRASSVQVGDPFVSHRGIVEPYGVVLEVLPWNGPLWTGVQRVAAILAAGNVAVVKPAEIASASFLHFSRLVADILPPGVLTVVPGGGSTVGAALTTHPGVDMVSLTGGVETGVRVIRDTAPQLKRLSLELGGKNPNIVLDDADLDQAVMWSTMGAFSNSGQVCVCGSRVFVQRGVHQEFAARFAQAAQNRVVGDPLEETTEMGPVVGGAHAEKVWSYIDTAIERGDGQLIAGGDRYSDERAGGWFIPPTVLDNVSPQCTIAREEVFGPLVTLTPVADLDEALQLANDSDYGLASGIFTSSVESAERAARSLQAGQVYVNQWFAPGGLQAPSQGYKHSGLGGVGIEKYQQVKNVFTRVPGNNWE